MEQSAAYARAEELLDDGLRDDIIVNKLMRDGVSRETAEQIVADVHTQQDDETLPAENEDSGSRFVVLDSTFAFDAIRALFLLVTGIVTFIRIVNGIDLIALLIAIGVIVTGVRGKLFTQGIAVAAMLWGWILFEIALAVLL